MMLVIVGFIGSLSTAAFAAPPTDTSIDINGSKHFTAPLVLKSTMDVKGVPTSFDNAAWFPGLIKSGTVRIQNSSFYKVKISSIALQVDGIADVVKKDDFSNNMNFKIIQGDYPNFTNAAIYNNTFSGIIGGKSVDIVIDRLGYVDFEYTVAMAIGTPNTLQGLNNIDISLVFNSSEIPAPSSGGGTTITTTYLISDMPPSHWAYQCVQTLLKNKTIELEPDNKIRPEESITRAEVAVLLAKALGLEPVDKLFSGFMDLGSISDEVKGYIIAVSEAGIFHGYPGWRFKPNDYISREELACVLVRAFEKKLTLDITLGYIDKDQISDWALNDVKAAIQHKLMGGYPDNTFGPKKFMTRAEAFSIICRTQAEK